MTMLNLIRITCILILVSIHRSQSSEEICSPPEVENGIVSGEFDGRAYFGTVTCMQGYELFGKQLIKCMNGIWSAEFPFCAKIGGCKINEIPEVPNGRFTNVRPYRGSVLRAKCNQGFKLFGQHMLHCKGNKWSLTQPPVCASRGCDESEFHDFENGITKRYLRGAVVTFECKQNFSLQGSETLICDGQKWNGTMPKCQNAPSKVYLTGPSQLRRDDGEVLVKCSADSSNPPTELTFRISSDKNQDDLLEHLIREGAIHQGKTQTNWSHENKGWRSARDLLLVSNKLTKSGLSQIKISCFAQSTDSGETKAKDNILLKIIGPPPQKVQVFGPTRLSFHVDHSFECRAAPSQPPAKLTWRLISNNVSFNLDSDDSDDSEDAEGTTSVLVLSPAKVLGSRRPREVMIECLAFHPELGKDHISFSHIVEIMYLPGVPEIFGVDDGEKIALGEEQSLTCSAQAGYPPAKLSWFRGQQMLKSHYRFDGDTVSAEIRFVPQPEDSDYEFRCESINDAMSQPFVSMIKIDVARTTTTASTTTTTTSTTTTTTTTRTTQTMPTTATTTTTYITTQTTMEEDEEDLEEAISNTESELDSDEDEMTDGKDGNYIYPDNYDDSKRELQDYEYNDSEYEYTEPSNVELDPNLKHPELVDSDLFKNIPLWPEQDIAGSNVHIQKVEMPELDLDQKEKDYEKVAKDKIEKEFNSRKIDLSAKSENEVFPKDAPYTQGSASSSSAITFSSIFHFLMLLLLTRV